MNKKKRIVIIIQARTESTRFPEKMTKYLGDYPLIEWVLSRAKKTKLANDVVLAIPDTKENDVLVLKACQLNIKIYRGSPEDVLCRFYMAACQYRADHIVRVCADNPFVDSEEVDRLIKFYLDKQLDYAFNHIPRFDNNYPDGLGAEIFSFDLLEYMYNSTKELSHREHVTRFIWDNFNDYNIQVLHAPAIISNHFVKLDVDQLEDLEKLNQLDCLNDLYVSAEKIVRAYERLFLR